MKPKEPVQAENGEASAFAKILGSRGGKSAAKKMTPEERAKRAKKASDAATKARKSKKKRP